MINLTRREFEALNETLLSAYPEHDDLERMVFFGLGKNLDAVAGGDDLNEIVFNLIQHCQSQGLVTDLVRSAIDSNPNNPQLLEFKKEFDARTEIEEEVEAAEPVLMTSNPDLLPVADPFLEPERTQAFRPVSNRQNGLMYVTTALTAALIALLGVLLIRSGLVTPSVGTPTAGGGGGEVTITVPTESPTTSIAVVAPATSTPNQTATLISPTAIPPTAIPPTSIPTVAIQTPPATQTPQVTSAPPADEQDLVQAIIAEEVRYGNARDMVGILSLWAADGKIVSEMRTPNYTLDDETYAGIDEIRTFYQSFFDLDWREYDIHSPTVTVIGDSAILVHEGTFSDGVHYRDDVTFNLEKSDDVWKIVGLRVGTTPP